MKKKQKIALTTLVCGTVVAIVIGVSTLPVLHNGDVAYDAEAVDNTNHIVFDDTVQGYDFLCQQYADANTILKKASRLNVSATSQKGADYLNAGLTKLSKKKTPVFADIAPQQYPQKDWDSAFTVMDSTLTATPKPTKVKDMEQFSDYFSDVSETLSDGFSESLKKVPMHSEATDKKVEKTSCERFLTDPPEGINQPTVDMATYAVRVRDAVEKSGKIFKDKSTDENMSIEQARKRFDPAFATSIKALTTVGSCPVNTVQYPGQEDVSSKKICSASNKYVSSFAKTMKDYRTKLNSVPDAEYQQVWEEFGKKFEKYLNKINILYYDLTHTFEPVNEDTQKAVDQILNPDKDKEKNQESQNKEKKEK